MLNVYVALQNALHRAKAEDGQTTIEYGLVIALVAIVLAIAMAGQLDPVIDTVVDKVEAAIPD